MSGLMVPDFDEKPWPTLGPQVCDWIEENLTFGPGDLLGQPARLDNEKRGLIYRMYEVNPPGHEEAGRRRFKRCALSLRKGSAKTELAAWIALAELHPRAPVRFVRWRYGKPVGGPVADPYIPMLAYTEEQSEELAFGAMRAILLQEGCAVGHDFDIGLQRIIRLDGSGKAVALATAPSSRDGARTTFQHFDETGHWILPRMKRAHQAMLANVPKRKAADAWSLETTTAPAPGSGAVAEQTMEYARAVAAGSARDSRLFFFHRQADPAVDISTPEGLRQAVLEASGPVAAWSDISSIMAAFQDQSADRSYLERMYLNRLVQDSHKAFDAQLWASLVRKGHTVPDGALVTLGFDGARRDDATALVATEVETGYQWPVGIWERPGGAAGAGWEVPLSEVDEAMHATFERWQVWRLYADPPFWETAVAEWARTWGDAVVIWSTRMWRKMSDACRAYLNAQLARDVCHSGDPVLARHLANAHRRPLQGVRDSAGEPGWIIQKERPDSPLKMDGAMAAILSWQARCDARAAGADVQRRRSVYEDRGLLEVSL